MTSPRIRRISHWAGIILAAPMFVAGLWLLREYFNGNFGNDVTLKDSAIVIGFVFVSTVAIYLAMRWAGILLSHAVAAFRNIGKGNGTTAGSRPSRPE